MADPELAAEYLAAGQHAFPVNRDAADALRLPDLALQLDPPAALLNEALAGFGAIRRAARVEELFPRWWNPWEFLRNTG